MATYKAEVRWSREQQIFLDRRYSRAHRWLFDGGAEVPASASPQNVPLPYSDPAAVDPEEAFVAALSSCHMLWFLDLAARAGFVIDSYVDEAVGQIGKDSAGRVWMERIKLQPFSVFSGDRLPSNEQIQALHHAAHEQCYLASSVKSEVVCEPKFA
jgi:organic hydroperoxide reductase OsmC/OhrA